MNDQTAHRTKIHDRVVHCQGFRRDDGLWDIEGELCDTKTYDFENRFRGTVKAGTPIHLMTLCLTVDNKLKIMAVKVKMTHTPYEICPLIEPNYQRLVGLKIRPGFLAQVRQLLGGVEGCLHLVELLAPIATTAFQTMVGEMKNTVPAATQRKPLVLNTCHAHAQSSPIVKEFWPQHYRPRELSEPDQK